MNGRFKLNSIKLALCLAFPAVALPVFAVEPFPPMPVTLSTAVTPNVMLVIDTSGSMDSPPSGGSTDKIVSVRKIATNLIKNNKALNWGVFTFDDGGRTGGVLKSGVLPVQANSTTTQAVADANLKTLTDTIAGLTASGVTPLGETLLEVSRYWAGESSYYSKTQGTPSYTSPMTYRCQKNFNIFLTDGEATSDDELPGLSQTITTNTNVCKTWNRWHTKCTEWETVDTVVPFPVIPYNTWNSSGVAQSLNFSVCKDTTTAINSNISCPANLEGQTSPTTITNKFNGADVYRRSIRDVAAYLYDRDFKYNLSALDGDGKSWDDPKFRKQNVMTYTVGFDTDNVILSATAQVGHGQYFTATNETDLNTAMTTVVQSIINTISNAGGVATTNPAKVAGNKMFQPVFNPDGWYGELRCYDYANLVFDSQGDIIGGACSVPKAVIPLAADRNIWSSTWAPGNVSFQFNTGNVAKMNGGSPAGMQLKDLGATATDQSNVINFVRGVDGANRVRSNGLLGDITDSQPLVVTAPSGVTTESTYATFKTSYANRNMVFIGANDGMLHAFDVATMSELMGYIPAPVYPHLAALPSKTYGAVGGAAHVYGVNGELRQADVMIGAAGSTPEWKTIVVGGLGQGGQGYFAIDATSDTNIKSKTTTPLKWEWNDQNDADVGYTFGAPVIYNVRRSATTVDPAVILVNGYENDYDDTAVGGKRRTTTCTPATTGANCNTSALYIVNAHTGALIKKFVLDAVSTGVGGLSSPAGVDFGQDGVLDYVYAGDMNGKLWRFDLTDDGNYAKDPKLIFDAGPTQPITLRPAIKQVTSSGGTSRGNLIYFGTGKLLTDADRNTTDQQTFYAVLDDMTDSSSTVVLTDLQQREFDTTEVTAPAGYRVGDYRKVKPLDASFVFDITSTDSAVNKNKKGWYINLPSSSERLVSSPWLVNYEVIFGTGIPAASEKCIPGGKGWVMGLDPLTGGVVVSGAAKKEFSFIDMNADGASTTADQLSGFTTGKSYVSGFSVSGIPTELTYVANASKIVTIETTGDKNLLNAGNVIALQDANIMAVYTGNAADNVSKGNAMGRPAPDETKGGEILACKIGTAGCDRASELPPPVDPVKRYKIETTIWREIK